jgi:serine/threonine protein kinase
MDHVSALIGNEYPIEIPLQFGRYEYIRTIGAGSFSVVILVGLRGTNHEFACKICSRELLNAAGIFDRFEREVRILQTFSHPALIRLLDIVYEPLLIYLIMEYCSNGELFDAVVTNRRLDESACRAVFAQLVDGLVYMHSHSMAHRDLKPENVLLDEAMKPKIADFGLAHPTNKNALLKTPCGSIYYAPPEILTGREYDGQKADVWSLGVVLYVMITGGFPWTTFNQGALINEITSGNFTLDIPCAPVLASLIGSMLASDPAARPTMAEIARHPWVFSPSGGPGNGKPPNPLGLPWLERRNSATLARPVAMSVVPKSAGRVPGLPTVPGNPAVKSLFRRTPRDNPLAHSSARLVVPSFDMGHV